MDFYTPASWLVFEVVISDIFCIWVKWAVSNFFEINITWIGIYYMINAHEYDFACLWVTFDVDSIGSILFSDIICRVFEDGLSDDQITLNFIKILYFLNIYSRPKQMGWKKRKQKQTNITFKLKKTLVYSW